MRLRRRKRQWWEEAFLAGSAAPPIGAAQTSANNIGSTFTVKIGPPDTTIALRKLRTANHHATELVNRLLRENRAQKQLIHRALNRQAAVSARLLNWLEGDGSKPREVLADLEEILSRS